MEPAADGFGVRVQDTGTIRNDYLNLLVCAAHAKGLATSNSELRRRPLLRFLRKCGRAASKTALPSDSAISSACQPGIKSR